METSAEACWRLSKACGQWAVESRDNAARIAFRQMATEWARLAFNEECIRLSPAANNPSSVAADALCRHTPKVGAACGNSARAVLCGGRSVTTVPTANRPETAAGPAMSAVLRSLPKR